MRYTKMISRIHHKIWLPFLLLLVSVLSYGQEKISIGLHAAPVISWFGTDIDAIQNEGSRPGFNFGLEFTKSFGPNYSFASGISLISAGGRLTSSETTVLELNELLTVDPGEKMIYKIQYLAIPLGLKLRTNQIGYVTFFSDVGLSPKVVVGSKIDVPSGDVSGEKAGNELRLFNAAYYINAGIEYGIGGNTALVIGLGFENNFFDVTKENGDQPDDKVMQRLLSFRFGINF